MKRIISTLLTAALLSFSVASAQSTIVSLDVDLWPEGMPNTNGIDSEPFDDSKQNFKPSMRVFLPAQPDGRAVICCPGGGYSHLAKTHEGYDWAGYFNAQGIALIVVTYRMPHGNKEVPISDITKAFQLVHKKAHKWNIDKDKIGIMGSSAGGHLASTFATHAKKSLKPAFQILFYPVISMEESKSHKGSCRNFLGEKPEDWEIFAYSNMNMVNKKTCPAILLLSDDDTVVPTSNSFDYFHALRKAGVEATIVNYPTGGHGWGCKPSFKYHQAMLNSLSAWLDKINL